MTPTDRELLLHNPLSAPEIRFLIKLENHGPSFAETALERRGALDLLDRECVVDAGAAWLFLATARGIDTLLLWRRLLGRYGRLVPIAKDYPTLV
jgi:hypothetical protein